MSESNKAYQTLLQSVRECRVLQSCNKLLSWDAETYMPPGAAAHRAEQTALLSRIHHEMATSPRIGDLLAEVEASPSLRDAGSDEAVNVREIRRRYDRAVRMPASLAEELARTTSLARQHWRQARAENDFSRFRPWLERIIKLKQEEAQAVGRSEVLYDALLDDYEPGALSADIEALFATLRAELVPMIAAVAQSGRRPPVEDFECDYPVESQREFAINMVSAVGFDFHCGRLDSTVHPFCSGIGPGDTRLTTRYAPTRFYSAALTSLHEAGHALYNQGRMNEHFFSPLGSSVSLGIDESQSRLIENQVGRSLPFWQYFYPIACKVFPSCLAGKRLADFYFVINEVSPSFIRVEADEATYNLHIILRFDIERALISGDLSCADLPGAWSDKFFEFFGIRPDSDSSGCLQDIHWSKGGFGYFPTYTLGNLYAAQFMETLRQEIPDLDDQFRQGEFGALKSWLNRNIHRHGQRYSAADLCREVTGRSLSHRPLISYLKDKFEPLYFPEE